MPDERATTSPHLTTMEITQTAVVGATVTAAELPGFFDRAFSLLQTVLSQQEATPIGPAFALSSRPPDETSALEVGFPLAAPIKPDGEVVPSTLPAGKVATVVYRGGYDGIAEAWAGLQEWVARQGLRAAPGSWEVYLTEPTPQGDPGANLTQLVQPLLEDQ